MTTAVSQKHYDAAVRRGKQYKTALERLIRTIQHKQGMFVAAELRASLAFREGRQLLEESYK